MTTPVDFCPAAAIARELARLESLIDMTRSFIAQAAPAADSVRLGALEGILESLILAADEARNRLAQAEPASSAGAIAQLLAAIRDIRVNDDLERTRAHLLEAHSTRFAADAALLDAGLCARLSQTRFAPALWGAR